MDIFIGILKHGDTIAFILLSVFLFQNCAASPGEKLIIAILIAIYGRVHD